MLRAVGRPSVRMALQPIVESAGPLLGVRTCEDHHIAAAITVAVDLLHAPFLRAGIGIVEDVQLSHFRLALLPHSPWPLSAQMPSCAGLSLITVPPRLHPQSASRDMTTKSVSALLQLVQRNFRSFTGTSPRPPSMMARRSAGA